MNDRHTAMPVTNGDDVRPAAQPAEPQPHAQPQAYLQPQPVPPSADPAPDAASSLPLQIWLSPAFPVGSFAYSHALEWAVQARQIHDLASATSWLGDLLLHGGLHNDAILLAQTWRAVMDGDEVALAEVNELALALAGSRERYLETSAQGNAFRLTIAAAWAPEQPDGLIGDVAYPVAVGAAAAAHRIALRPLLEAYAASAVSSLTSALVRLGALGPSDGQRAIAGLLPHVERLAAKAAVSTLDDLGGCTFQSDIATLRHETQYTRLFRT